MEFKLQKQDTNNEKNKYHLIRLNFSSRDTLKLQMCFRKNKISALQINLSF